MTSSHQSDLTVELLCVKSVTQTYKTILSAVRHI